jgi:hypothetical protein
MEMYWRKNEKEVEKVFEQLGETSDSFRYGSSGLTSSYKAPSVKI